MVQRLITLPRPERGRPHRDLRTHRLGHKRVALLPIAVTVLGGDGQFAHEGHEFLLDREHRAGDERVGAEGAHEAQRGIHLIAGAVRKKSHARFFRFRKIHQIDIEHSDLKIVRQRRRFSAGGLDNERVLP